MSNPIDNLAADSAELMSLLERGLGRALIFLRGKDPSRFRHIILYACLNNLVFDGQCEPNRAPYMYDVLNTTGEPAYYAPYIREAVRATTDERDLEQLVEIALLMAKDGDQEAREALYSLIANQKDQEGMTVGAEELIKLDGIEGLVHVAHNRVHPKTGDFYYGFAIRYVDILDEQMGKEASRAAMKTLSETDSDVARLLAEAEWFEQTLPERRKRPAFAPLPSFGEFRKLLSAGRSMVALTTLQRWGEEADEEFVRLVAEEVLAENDPRHLFRLLYFFKKRPFPGDPARLIELSKSDDDREIGRPARIALGNVVHSSVRTLAIALLRDPFTAGDAIDMLSRNYELGDYEIVLAALLKEMDRDCFHRLGIGLMDFCKAHPLPAARSVLMAVYEDGYCTMCRKRVVEMLMELGPLPEWMVEECRYDANLDLRRLVGA